MNILWKILKIQEFFSYVWSLRKKWVVLGLASHWFKFLLRFKWWTKLYDDLFNFTHLIQISSVAQSCPTLCNPIDCCKPGFPNHHQLPQLAQIHVYHVGDAIQPSRLLLSPLPLAFNLSQNQGLFQWVSSLHQVARVLEFQLQNQSVLPMNSQDWFPLG